MTLTTDCLRTSKEARRTIRIYSQRILDTSHSIPWFLTSLKYLHHNLTPYWMFSAIPTIFGHLMEFDHYRYKMSSMGKMMIIGEERFGCLWIIWFFVVSRCIISIQAKLLWSTPNLGKISSKLFKETGKILGISMRHITPKLVKDNGDSHSMDGLR